MMTDLQTARHCLHLYRHSHAECQWQAHYASVTGQWEWYFW